MAHGNKTIPIPIELRGSSNNIAVASTESIYDYLLDKSQEEINQITDTLSNKISDLESKSLSTVRTLKDEPDAYLRNVHYDISNNNVSHLSTYIRDIYGRYDQPLPIDFTNYNVDEIHKTAKGGVITIPENRLLYNLIPGNRYFYVDLSTNSRKSFYVEQTRRFIYAGRIKNIRDLGGIPVEGGGYIAYDKIFRGSEITGNVINAQEEDYNFLKDLDILLELDLRNESELGNSHTDQSLFADSYARVPFFRFEELNTLNEEKRFIIAQLFTQISSLVVAGYKIYFHCAWGYHRAGFLAALIEGVLGAKQCEIDKDYELSSFANISSTERVTRNDNNYKRGIKYINDNFNGSWESFLIWCGVSSETIKAFKNAMIVDKQRDSISDNYYETTYENLINLKNSKSLVPGAKYRMIDYLTESYYDALNNEAVCSDGVYDLAEYKSLEQPFDLVLTALSDSELDSNVKAVHSKRDTRNYFKDVDLSKWELKYDINNDKSKYSWAVNDDVEMKIIDESAEFIPGHYYKSDNLTVYLLDSNHYQIIEASDTYQQLIGEGTCEIGSDALCLYLNQSETSRYYLFKSSITEHYYFGQKHLEGKGVIYYMKDENNNEAPYDFKNIVFKYKGQFISNFSEQSTYTGIDNISIQTNLSSHPFSLTTTDNPSTQEYSNQAVFYSNGTHTRYDVYIRTKLTNSVKIILTALENTGYQIYDLSGHHLGSINNYPATIYITPNNQYIHFYLERPTVAENSYEITMNIFGNYQYEPCKKVFNNVIKPLLEGDTYDSSKPEKYSLNNNLFISGPDQIIKDCFLDSNSKNNLLTGECVNCKIGKNTSNIKLNNPEVCVIGDNCFNISSLDNCEHLYVGNECYNLNISRAQESLYLKVDDFIHDQTITANSAYAVIKNANIVDIN